jgi:DNA-binding XRE family transcriptional regulator
MAVATGEACNASARLRALVVIDKHTPGYYIGRMNVEVRATGLRAMRDKHHLTQRELAHRLGVTQNYIPALEAGTRNPGPKLRQQLMQLFQCDFEDLFQVVMINPLNNHETLLKPVQESRAEAS